MSARHLVLAALLLAGPVCAKEAIVEHEYFWFSTSLQDGKLSSTFFHSGRSTAQATGNVDGRQEIGRYEAVLPADTLDRLRKLKANVDLDRLQSPDSLRPGEATITIGESRNPEGPVPYLWTLSGIPPAVQPLLDEARRLSEEVMKHRIRVLRGRGSARSPSFPAGSTATFEVTLECVGTKPLRATNPLSTKDPKYTGLRLVVTRDVPTDRPDYKELWLDLTPQHVLPLPGAAPDGGAVLDLKPGQKRTFVVSHALLAAPGRYHAFLLYHSTPPRGDDDFLQGTIRIDLGAIELTAAKH